MIDLTTYWTVRATPGDNAQATVSQTGTVILSGGHNVCTAFSVAFVAGTTAPTAVNVTVAVIDGPTGGTTYLWGPHDISLPAIAGAMNGFALSGMHLRGTPGRAMTIQFSGAGGANTKQSVWMTGTVEL